MSSRDVRIVCPRPKPHRSIVSASTRRVGITIPSPYQHFTCQRITRNPSRWSVNTWTRHKSRIFNNHSINILADKLRVWQNVGIREQHFWSYTVNNEIHSAVGRSHILEVLYFENVSITVWNRICKMAFFYNLFCMGVGRGLRVERNVIVLRGTCR